MKSVKVELSVEVLSVVAEALAEAGSVEWLRGDAGDADAKARYVRYWSALYELRMAGCHSMAGSRLGGGCASWGGVHRWFRSLEKKGSSLAWSARDSVRESVRAEMSGEGEVA